MKSSYTEVLRNFGGDGNYTEWCMKSHTVSQPAFLTSQLFLIFLYENIQLKCLVIKIFRILYRKVYH